VIGIREIRSRIKSAESTDQLSRSMKMLSAAKLRRCQEKGRTLRDFASECADILSLLPAEKRGKQSPLSGIGREIKKRCYVLFVGSRGLCGGYNREMLRTLSSILEEETGEYSLVVCGRWGRDNVPEAGYRVLRCFDEISDVPSADEARELGEYLRELYLSGEADEIRLVYREFRPGKAKVLNQIFLPAASMRGSGGRDVIVEPDTASVRERLLELYIQNSLHSVLLESKMSEHLARMTAMTSAADNTENLLKKLNLELNHARQESITTEITELANSGIAGEEENRGD